MLSRSISKSLTRIRLAHSLEARPLAEALVARGILPVGCEGVSPVLVRRRCAVERGRLRDGLGRKVKARPGLGVLVQRGFMPGECVRGGAAVAPGLVGVRRRVMREALKDGLRAWVEGRGVGVDRRRKRENQWGEEERVSVRALVRWYTVRSGIAGEREGVCEDALEIEKRMAQRRWRRELKGIGDSGGRRKGLDVQDMDTGEWARPARAHVLGLRRFWEGVIESGAR